MKAFGFDFFDYLQGRAYNPQRVEVIEDEMYKITWAKLVLTYLIGGLAGTLWETALVLYRGHFELRNGSFFLPFNPVYGFGLCAIILFLHKLNTSKQVFFVGAVVGGVAEYTLSYLQELFLGSKSWDYSNRFLNINGRTTILYCVFWGAGCLFIMKVVYPFIFKRIFKIKQKHLAIIGVVFTVIIVIDLFCTAGGLLRYSMRYDGIEATTWLGKFFDTLFPDERVKLCFPNLKLA